MTDLAEDYAAIKQRVGHEIEQVSNSPQGRYRMREAFYRSYGGGSIDLYGWGESELNFLRWEIRRGVLNPTDDPTQPGSPWWRAVNSAFLRDAAIADSVHRAGIVPDPDDVAVLAWLEFIRRPGASAWYRAHNTSIVHGYRAAAGVAANHEQAPERAFMNVVLYRLLYAQSMIMGDSPFRQLGELLTDPVGPAVDVLVHIPAFYPDHYPLTEQDIQDIRDRGHTIGGELCRFFDRLLVLPELEKLYTEASTWNVAPFLPGWAGNDCPCYP